MEPETVGGPQARRGMLWVLLGLAVPLVCVVPLAMAWRARRQARAQGLALHPDMQTVWVLSLVETGLLAGSLLALGGVWLLWGQQLGELLTEYL